MRALILGAALCAFAASFCCDRRRRTPMANTYGNTVISKGGAPARCTRNYKKDGTLRCPRLSGMMGSIKTGRQPGRSTKKGGAMPHLQQSAGNASDRQHRFCHPPWRRTRSAIPGTDAGGRGRRGPSRWLQGIQ